MTADAQIRELAKCISRTIAGEPTLVGLAAIHMLMGAYLCQTNDTPESAVAEANRMHEKLISSLPEQFEFYRSQHLMKARRQH